ncbi:MAG: hypothetical protein LBP27_01165 [Treponema sp.]|jgi:hypothetical protein|nr:hypothetical protein [Treponema sp.]
MPGKGGVFFLFLLFAAGGFLFARGKQDEAEKTELNTEWILCVTGFDISALPPDKRIIGEVITRSLVDTLKTVNHRIRISPEYAYYEGYAWFNERAAAARALAAKQDERTLSLYRGDPDWKYRQNLKTVDAEIVKLREELEKKEKEMPLIAREPAFGVTAGNSEGNFPNAPKQGGEYSFCRSQKADAFLAGSISDYHGRYYVRLRLYVVYTRSFIYEDDIIFSSDDTQAAVDEIAGRLTAALAGSKPAAIAVRAEPAETLVLINRNFAGRGDVEAREHPPGKVNISLSADDYRPETVETELSPGELTELRMSLLPVELADVTISAVPGDAGASVYRGAIYVGEAPLTLRLPVNQLDYINMEAPGGKSAAAVFRTPRTAADSGAFSFRIKISPPSGQKRVDRARRWYYWAWGGTWISGIAAWISYGMFTTQSTALAQSYSMDFFEDTERLWYISMGSLVLVGAAVAHEIIQMARYLYVATEDATPLVR